MSEIDIHNDPRLERWPMPFADTLGIELVSGSTARVEATISWAPERCTTGGIMHGGYLMAVADSVGAMLAMLNLAENAGTATIESKTNFLRGAVEGDLTVVSTPVHVGRTTIVVQTDIARADGKLVTRTTQTQAVFS